MLPSASIPLICDTRQARASCASDACSLRCKLRRPAACRPYYRARTTMHVLKATSVITFQCNVRVVERTKLLMYLRERCGAADTRRLRVLRLNCHALRCRSANKQASQQPWHQNTVCRHSKGFALEVRQKLCITSYARAFHASRSDGVCHAVKDRHVGTAAAETGRSNDHAVNAVSH